MNMTLMSSNCKLQTCRQKQGQMKLYFFFFTNSASRGFLKKHTHLNIKLKYKQRMDAFFFYFQSEVFIITMLWLYILKLDGAAVQISAGAFPCGVYSLPEEFACFLQVVHFPSKNSNDSFHVLERALLQRQPQ